MSLGHGPNIVRDSLLFHIDASNIKSYPGSGTTCFDISGQSNNSTIVGAFTYSTGKFTIANVNTAYLNQNNPVNFRMGVQDFTISAWVKQLDNGTNVLTEARGTNLQGYIFILNYATGKMAFFVNSGSGQNIYSTVRADLPFGSPQNIVIVVSRTLATLTFYVNGVFWETISSIQPASISPVSGDIYRNGYDLGGTTANMEFYAYSHYGRALTAIEVTQNFNALRGRYGI